MRGLINVVAAQPQTLTVQAASGSFNGNITFSFFFFKEIFF
jgi:hypothetical protein